MIKWKKKNNNNNENGWPPPKEEEEDDKITVPEHVLQMGMQEKASAARHAQLILM